MYLNKIFLVGNLTRDPELKAMQSGTKVCNFSIATNSSYKNKDGQKVDRPEYHSVVCYGGTAENSAKFLKKGQQVLIEGMIATRSWDKQDGTKAYKTEIIAHIVQFGARPKTASGAMQDGEPTIDAETGVERTATKIVAKQAPAVIMPGQARLSDDQIEYPTDDIDPDSIPF